MRSSLTWKVALLLIVSACDTFLSYVLFLSYDAQSNPASLNLAGRQRMIAVQLGDWAEMVASGQGEDRAGLRERIATFDSTLTVLEQGGEIDGYSLPSAPQGAAASVAGVRDLWSDLRPRLLVIADRPTASPETERAYRGLRTAIEDLRTRSDQVAAAIQGQILAARARFLRALAAMAGVSLALLVLGLWYARRFVVRPVLVLDAVARRIHDGDLAARVEVPRDNDLASLARTFNDMAARVQQLLLALDLRRRHAEILTDNMPIGSALLDRSLVVIRSCRSFCEMLQRSEAEINGRPVTEFLSAEGLAEQLLAVIQSGETARGLRFVLTGSDGVRRFLRVSAAATRLGELEQEQAARLVLLVEDLTEEERLRAVAQAAEVRLSHLVAMSPAIIYAVSPGTNGATFVGSNVTAQTGFESRDFIENPSFWAERIHPDDLQRVIAEKSMRPEHGRLSVEYRFRHKDGTYRWMLDDSRLVRDAEGEPTEIVGSGFDITERRQAEEMLRESEDRYAAVFRGAAEGILVADSETARFAYANPAICQMLGYSEEELTHLGVQDIHPAESLEHTLGEFEAINRGDKHIAPDIPCRRKDGSVIYADITGSVAMIDNRRRTLGFFSDVTGRKRAEAERKEFEQQLRMSQKMEAIGSLAGGVAHDFNNLLSVILSNTGFAMDGVPEGDPRADDLLEVKKAADRAAALTRQLLAFSRKQVLQPVLVSLNQIADGVEKMLRRILGEDIDYVQTLAPDLGLTLADPGQIEQVIMNLVVNARDAMPEGGKLTIETANVEIDGEYATRHVAVTPGSYVQLAVTDTGCGMDEQTKARIFEPFFTTKAKGRGTGLGLSTVYGIVKQSGGNIWVYSELGKGTTFKVYLPRDLSATTETAIKASTVPTQSTGTETILVVEDEEALRKLAKRSLEAVGYRVLIASDGDDALLTCAQHVGQIHLLLTDVVMPRMSGKTLAQELSKKRPSLKVVYMSGYTDNAIVHHGVLDAGTHFLGKPFTSADLTRKAREVLDGDITGLPDGRK